jgi:hypothetical protein
MIRISELKLPLSALPVEVRRAADAPSETDEDRTPPPHPEAALRQLAAKALGIAAVDIATLQVFKRSFDARKADLLAVFIVDITLSDAPTETAVLQKFDKNPHIQATPDITWHAPCHAPAGFGGQEGERPVVVGFGPCGMFAALSLAQMGFKPIVLERGKKVRERTKDTWGLWRKQTLNPESNVQFGEGGAGTFSDGKLYSQIKDPRHLGRKVMDEFVKAGAPSDILFAAHPHIGTFKLVKVVEHIREQIMSLGGEIRFEQRVSDVLLSPADGGQQITGLQVQDLKTGESHTLATRHVVPQLTRHLCHAAPAWCGAASQIVFDWRAHRAPAKRDRPSPLGPPRRPSAAGCSRLQAGPPRRQRPCGVQLLHVPWRHGGGRDQRTGPCGDQRHEPILA